MNDSGRSVNISSARSWSKSSGRPNGFLLPVSADASPAV